MTKDKSIGRIAWDCFIDLGITVVYATIAGLLIVGVVATDDGRQSLLQSALYASLLPAAVVVLIGFDVMLRILAERRALRRRRSGRSAAHGQAMAMSLQRF